MNKEEIIARPYEEYYEMIKDMSKDNMIQGLYDLSKNCIEYQNYINQLEEKEELHLNRIDELTDRVVELQQKVNQLETNRDEAIEYIKSNPNVFYDEYLIDVETLLENECTDEIAGEIRFISTLLSILERGKE